MLYFVTFLIGTVFGFFVCCLNWSNGRFPDDEEDNNNNKK